MTDLVEKNTQNLTLTLVKIKQTPNDDNARRRHNKRWVLSVSRQVCRKRSILGCASAHPEFSNVFSRVLVLICIIGFADYYDTCLVLGLLDQSWLLLIDDISTARRRRGICSMVLPNEETATVKGCYVIPVNRETNLKY